MRPVQRAYLELHIAVLSFGFTAILGKLIQLNAFMLVWWRVLLTSLSLILLLKGGAILKTLPKATILRIMGIGVLVALHWLAFYGAIKVANSSIALVGMATSSFFTALLEPAIMRQRIKPLELGLGILIIPGMALVVQSIQGDYLLGMIIALVSAFLAALFGTLNKYYMARNAEPLSMTFLQLGSSWLFLSLLLWPAQRYYGVLDKGAFPPSISDWIYLLVLVLFCTTLGYVLALRALRQLSAFASALTVNLEPVYGIALAWLILEEHRSMTPKFYFGSAIIVLAVFLYPWLKRRIERR